MKRSPVKPGSTPIKRTAFARAVRIENREIAKVSIKEKKLRTRKCAVKACRKGFAPRSMTHKTCSPECAQEYVRIEKARTDRKERQEGLAKLRSRTDHLRLAQMAVNALVRYRDRNDDCISCDRPSNWPGQWHASHFKSVGSSPALRFDLANIHKACSICNNHLSGNIAAYAPRLLAKIGVTEFDRINGPQPLVKYSIEDILLIKTWAVKHLRELSKGKL